LWRVQQTAGAKDQIISPLRIIIKILQWFKIGNLAGFKFFSLISSLFSIAIQNFTNYCQLSMAEFLK